MARIPDATMYINLEAALPPGVAVAHFALDYLGKIGIRENHPNLEKASLVILRDYLQGKAREIMAVGPPA